MPTRPIKDPRPKFTTEMVVAAVRKDMEAWGATILRKFTDYPPQVESAKPTYAARRNRRKGQSRRVLKGGYRRTGTLRRSWFMETKLTGRNLVLLVASSDKIAPYNVYVQGPRDSSPGQTKLHAAHGWPSVPVEANKELPKLQRTIQATVKRMVT